MWKEAFRVRHMKWESNETTLASEKHWATPFFPFPTANKLSEEKLPISCNWHLENYCPHVLTEMPVWNEMCHPSVCYPTSNHTLNISLVISFTNLSKLDLITGSLTHWKGAKQWNTKMFSKLSHSDSWNVFVCFVFVFQGFCVCVCAHVYVDFSW